MICPGSALHCINSLILLTVTLYTFYCCAPTLGVQIILVSFMHSNSLYICTSKYTNDWNKKPNTKQTNLTKSSLFSYIKISDIRFMHTAQWFQNTVYACFQNSRVWKWSYQHYIFKNNKDFHHRQQIFEQEKVRFYIRMKESICTVYNMVSRQWGRGESPQFASLWLWHFWFVNSLAETDDLFLAVVLIGQLPHLFSF